ncbi:RNA-binding protein with serine-rich domain [Heracleum sosnowskyi]|uniref:RNA-binding protein with serine-rich domain n=1 Tax=Heracleum sosnowskyi TaxID=360622 RepID=A0AAD8HRW6_9APIA|nr:RNA-binding protein with serine-rich domain [Heracleum sosnowskyi]
MSVLPRSAYSHYELSTYNSVSTTLPPPPQVMGRPPEYPGFDPNRIPASVFTTNKPASGMEWSVASNESLFSIQMGNMSFTRDHFNWMKSGELKSPPGLPSISETPSINFHGLPVVNEVELDNGRKSASSWGRKSLESEANKTNKEISTSADKIRLSDRSSNSSDGHGMLLIRLFNSPCSQP